jgi:uncharacterized protein YeaC (DUF1315 family)
LALEYQDFHKKHKGKAITSRETYQPIDDDIQSGSMYPEGRVLGGRKQEKSMRELMLEAATLRLTKEEEEISRGCGSRS